MLRNLEMKYIPFGILVLIAGIRFFLAEGCPEKQMGKNP